jgi:hypothetical protein
MTQAAITTIKIEYTEAATIRCVARKDLPELGIKEGSCFYLARSSKNDGTYYIAIWNYAEMTWDCRCPATKPCYHMGLISKDCHKEHVVQGYKPLTKAQKFALLRQKYDYRYQAPARQDAEWLQEQLRSAVNRQVAEIMSGERVVVAPLNGNRAFSILR